MTKKSVSDNILDSFTDAINQDNLFKGISNDLVKLIQSGKPSKKNFEDLFRRTSNENSES